MKKHREKRTKWAGVEVKELPEDDGTKPNTKTMTTTRHNLSFCQPTTKIAVCEWWKDLF